MVDDERKERGDAKKKKLFVPKGAPTRGAGRRDSSRTFDCFLIVVPGDGG